MSLEKIQQKFRKVLLEPEGYKALADDQSWNTFLAEDDNKMLTGIPRERLALYENLLLSSVAETLSNIYPYCKMILEEQWLNLAELYRRNYPNQGFQLFKSSEKFPLFLSEQDYLLEDYPFIGDLALYEWVEVEVLNLPDISYPDNFKKSAPENATELVSLSPFWNPCHRYLSVDYMLPDIIDQITAIQKTDNIKERIKSYKEIIADTNHSKFIVYRDTETFKAKYFQMNDLVYRLIIASRPDLSYYQTIEKLWNEEPLLNDIPFNSVLNGADNLIKSCYDNNLLLGSRVLN